MADPDLVEHLRLNSETCSTCGYALRGLTHDSCPECGSSFSLEEFYRRRAKRTPWPEHLYGMPGWWLTIAVLVFAWLLASGNGPERRSPEWTVIHSLVLGRHSAGGAVPLICALLIFHWRTSHFDRDDRWQKLRVHLAWGAVVLYGIGVFYVLT